MLQGGAALFSALCGSNTITGVDLSGMSGINRNHIGVKGCTALADCLRCNEVLVSLNLDENGIGLEGLGQLVQGFPGNSSLTHLSIASNNIVRFVMRVH